MNFNSIMVGSQQPERLTAYYRKVFGEPTWEDEGFAGFQIGTGYLAIGPHSEVHGENAQPGRLIWNVETPDVVAEFGRMRDAGATVVREPYHPGEAEGMWIATFADPDGNYFQLMSPMPEEG